MIIIIIIRGKLILYKIHRSPSMFFYQVQRILSMIIYEVQCWIPPGASRIFLFLFFLLWFLISSLSKFKFWCCTSRCEFSCIYNSFVSIQYFKQGSYDSLWTTIWSIPIFYLANRITSCKINFPPSVYIMTLIKSNMPFIWMIIITCISVNCSTRIRCCLPIGTCTTWFILGNFISIFIKDL